MANFLRTLFIPKNISSKNQSINLSNKLLDKNISNINTNNTINININESELNNLEQKSIDITNVLSNYCFNKEENNVKMSIFLEKIKNLNAQFYNNREKFLLTKSSLEKISDDLFIILFKQINIYMEEIQRINKKIMTIDNKDYKQIIKKLNKEIAENKVKINNYEIKIKEKENNENKLIKEVEYYKRRLIFFKNKININLISKKIDDKNSDIISIKINETKKKKFIKKRNSINCCDNITPRFTNKSP
jgi:hypothetical protein